MNKQEIFDKVAKHLLKQNAKSMLDDEDTCAYRGENGMRCAIGALIPNTLYRRDMENQGVYPLMRSWPNVRNHLGVTSGHDEDFLASLQAIHDSNPVVRWRDMLYNFAEIHKLSVDVLV